MYAALRGGLHSQYTTPRTGEGTLHSPHFRRVACRSYSVIFMLPTTVIEHFSLDLFTVQLGAPRRALFPTCCIQKANARSLPPGAALRPYWRPRPLIYSIFHACVARDHVLLRTGHGQNGRRGDSSYHIM